MTPRYGIDTSILVRLATGDPESAFERSLARLTELIEQDNAEIFASNQVIGESYIALQHHYGVSKSEARAALTDVLCSGLVAPLNGHIVVESLATGPPSRGAAGGVPVGGCGLLDRLIEQDYSRSGLFTLTLDQRMAGLEGARLLYRQDART